MKVPRRSLRSFTLILTVGLLTGCPPGTKTSIEAGIGITVDPAHCKEDRTSPSALAGPPEMSLLDCSTLEGTGTIRISFPRKTWNALKADGAGGLGEGRDAGPGK